MSDEKDGKKIIRGNIGDSDQGRRSINESDQGRNPQDNAKGNRGRTTTTSEKPPKPKNPKR